MSTIIKAIQSLISYPILLVFFILPVISDLSFPPLILNVRNKGSGQLATTLPLSYIYYLPNKNIEEEFGSKYFIKSNVSKPIKLYRLYLNNADYDTHVFTLSKFLCYVFIVILISYIQGIAVISIPLGGHAPPGFTKHFIWQ